MRSIRARIRMLAMRECNVHNVAFQRVKQNKPEESQLSPDFPKSNARASPLDTLLRVVIPLPPLLPISCPIKQSRLGESNGGEGQGTRSKIPEYQKVGEKNLPPWRVLHGRTVPSFVVVVSRRGVSSINRRYTAEKSADRPREKLSPRFAASSVKETFRLMTVVLHHLLAHYIKIRHERWEGRGEVTVVKHYNYGRPRRVSAR